MILGRIVEIMESWPLELVVDSDGRSIFVGLQEETVVLSGEALVGPGSLAPGQNVAVKISTGERCVAEEIVILSGG